MQDLVFDAQSALLLDEPRSARRLVGARRGAAARPARRAGCAATRPQPHRATSGRRSRRAAARGRARATRSRLAAAARPAAGRAAARQLRGHARRGARRRRAQRAATWLLLREFRKATRFTRPGVDATLAVRELARGKAGPRQALLGVKKDLLDAYQARLADQLGRGGRRRRARLPRALGADRRAGRGALADPRARVRADARRRRHAREADAAFARLERSARRGDAGGFAAARSEVADGALDGFTAAPFTAEEQARRAGQLIRFVELIPVDYDHGTDDGKVTIPFEIQESIAFSEGALSAFSDLEEELAQRDPRATEQVAARARAAAGLRRGRPRRQAGRLPGHDRVQPRSGRARRSTRCSRRSGSRTTPSPTST